MGTGTYQNDHKLQFSHVSNKMFPQILCRLKKTAFENRYGVITKSSQSILSVQFVTFESLKTSLQWTSLIILELGVIKEKRFLTSSHS